MTGESLARLEYFSDHMPGLFRKISEDDFASKPRPDKWSKKEILGHLIDSATNNHQRFLRVRFEDTPTIVYDQEKWNNFTHYNKLDSEFIISFWVIYNKFIIKLLKDIPEEDLLRKCIINDGETVTLGWLIDDYVKHMEHHLRQITDY